MEDEEIIINPELNSYFEDVPDEYKQEEEFSPAVKKFIEESLANYRDTSHLGSRFINVNLTNRDYLTGYENPLEQDIEELRAQRQSGWTKAGRGILRAANKAASEFLKLPGLVIGAGETLYNKATGSDVPALESMFNNSWTKSIAKIEHSINDNLLPVYVKKSIKEGNLMDNLLSVDFWATEGADGVGFLVGMMAPGALLNKASLGSKLIGVTGSLFKNSDKANKITMKATEVAKSLGITAENIDLAAITTANTLVEAGAESSSAGDAYMLKAERLIAEGKLTYEEALQGKARVMRDVFASNVAILAGPNAIMSKMIWGKSIDTPFKKIFNKSGDLLEESGKRSQKEIAKEILPNTLAGGLREGAFEEGLQTTAENYFTDKEIKGEGVKRMLGAQLAFIGDLPKAYTETVSTVEGQKAVALGAILSAPIQLVTDYISEKNKDKQLSNLLGKLQNLDNFYNVFTEDIYDKDGNIDKVKFSEKTKGFENFEKISELYDIAMEDGRSDIVDAIHTFTTGEMAASLIMEGATGEDVLKQYLENSKGVKELASREEKEVDDMISDIMGRAKSMRQAFQSVQEYGPSIIPVGKETTTEEDKVAYFASLGREYMRATNFKNFYSELYKKEVTKYNDILKSLTGDEVKTLSDKIGNLDKSLEEMDSNKYVYPNLEGDIRLENSLDALKQTEKVINKFNKDLSDFWKKSTHEKNFDEFTKVREDIRKAAEEEEELTKASDAIKRATTEEEVNAVKVPNNIGGKTIEAEKQQKIAELKLNKEKAKQEAVKKQQETITNKEEQEASDLSEESHFANNAVENFNVGETIPLPAKIAHKYNKKLSEDNDDYTSFIKEASDITDTHVTFTVLDTSGIQSVKVPRKEVITETTHETSSTTEDELLTEGDGIVTKGESVLQSDKNRKATLSKAKDDVILMSTNARDNYSKFPYVSDKFFKYERSPKNKEGTVVNFGINDYEGMSPDESAALTAYNNGDYSNMDLLIDYLPLDIAIEGANDTRSPLIKKYKSYGNYNNYNKGPRKLRAKVIEALSKGANISEINTTISSQYPGALQLDGAKGDVRENSILDFKFLKGLSKKEKLKYIKDNIAFVDKKGNLVFSNGKKKPFSAKSNQVGNIYLQVPRADGSIYNLKLNIRRVNSDVITDLLYELYNIRIKDSLDSQNKEVDKLTTVGELPDSIKENLLKVLGNHRKIFDKGINDITIKDIIDLLIFDNTSAVNNKIRFTGTGKKGEAVFEYGNEKTNGTKVRNSSEFDKDSFVNWLKSTKRFGVAFKTNAATKRPSIMSNDTYLEFLLDNKILNTNAVVGEQDLFGQMTNLYISTSGVNAPIPSSSNDIEVNKEQELKNSYTDLQSAKKGDTGIYWTQIKGSRQDWEVDKQVKVKAVSKDGILFEGKTEWVNFRDGWHYFKNDRLIENINKKYENLTPAEEEEVGEVTQPALTPEQEKQMNKEIKAVNQRITTEIMLTADGISASELLEEVEKRGEVEINAIKEKYLGKSKPLEKTPEKIRNSEKNSVYLHEQPNTEENKKVQELQQSQEHTDSIEVTGQLVESLIEEFLDKGYIKDGPYLDSLLDKSNQEAFNSLKEIAEANNQNINDIIKKCS